MPQEKKSPHQIRQEIGGLGHYTNNELIYYDLGDPESETKFKNALFIAIMLLIFAFTFIRHWAYNSLGIELTYVHLILLIFALGVAATWLYRQKRDRDIMEAAVPLLRLNDRGIFADGNFYEWQDLESISYVKVVTSNRYGQKQFSNYLAFLQKSSYKDDEQVSIPTQLFSDPAFFMDYIEKHLGQRPRVVEIEKQI